MAEPTQSSNHSYMLDPENAAEMARLLLQDCLLNTAMKGLVPERTDLSTIHDVLDLACGPAGWSMGLAREYPQMQVIGADISALMISYARAQCEREKITNACFEVMNILEPLAFADGSFDLVNMRAVFATIPRASWPAVLLECKRVLRPGGIMRLTEFDLPGITSSASYHHFNSFGTHLFQQRGYGFSPDRTSFGITPMLRKLLVDVGFEQVSYQPHVIDFSYGMPLHASQVQNVSTVFKQAQVPIVKFGLASAEEVERTYARLVEDMRSEDFVGLQYWLTAWGQKPEG